MPNQKIDEGLVDLYRNRGWISADDQLTPNGLHALATLLNFLPPFHKGRWGEVFVPFMEKIVPTAVELVIVRNHKVLLTHRTDQYFTGWHTPGTYVGPRETRQETAQRCADKELKVQVRYIRDIDEKDHPDSPRFHDQCILLLCEIAEGEPKTGQWFSEMPPDLIPEHRKYWPSIQDQLEQLTGTEKYWLTAFADETPRNPGNEMIDKKFLPPDYEE